MSNVDESKRRIRRGPVPLPAAELRRHTVSVRLNAAELAQLDAQRAPLHMERGEYLRAAALHRLPPTIPEINREAWASLARVAGNLNQHQTAINEGRADATVPAEVLEDLRGLVGQLRADLIGVRRDEPEDEGEPDESES